MPPPVITKVIPMLTTPITLANLRTVSMLSTLANWSPSVITPATQIRASATMSPRLRPRLPCSSPPPVRAVSSAACSTRAVSAVTSASWDTETGWSLSVMRLFLP